MSRILTTFRVFNSRSIRLRALFSALVLFVCLTAAQTTLAQLNLTVTRSDDRNYKKFFCREISRPLSTLKNRKATARRISRQLVSFPR